MGKEKIYTHNIAADIVEKFDDLLCLYNIKIPSPEDDERENDNEAALYGSVYDELLDSTEYVLISMLDKIGVDYISYEFSGSSKKPERTYTEKETVCVRNEAEEIIKTFERLLYEQKISISPSEDPDRKALFGHVYDDLINDVKKILFCMLEEAGVKDYHNDELTDI